MKGTVFAAKVYSFKPGCLYFPISNKKIYAAPWGLDRRGWKASKDTERYYGLLKVEKVNNIPADDSMRRPYFDDLTPIYPKKQIILTSGKLPLSTRIIDLVAPIGFGQRE